MDVMDYVEITPFPNELKDSNLIRKCCIQRINKDIHVDSAELWFEFDRSIEPPSVDDCDSYLLAVIMDAMKENRNVFVRGTVSAQLLSNLVEYQAAWHKWLPDLYSCIHIEADKISLTEKPATGAICAFSGGVDATFSVWRHSQSNCSYRSQKINFCSLVHGFDIPLQDQQAFIKASALAQNTLANINLPLVPIRTNLKEIAKTNWEHAFLCALVATLSNFKNVASTCIVGSSEPYDALIVPWGSSPITDHLLSSCDFIVMHDGASHSRTEKVREIAEWKIGTENLRVCWQGDLKDRNCGVCEKCVRTKLNFLASNQPIPSCFPSSDIIEDLKKIVLYNDAVRAEWKQIYGHAKKNGISADWLNKLSRIFHKKVAIVDIVFPHESKRRKLAKFIKNKFT